MGVFFSEHSVYMITWTNIGLTQEALLSRKKTAPHASFEKSLS